MAIQAPVGMVAPGTNWMRNLQRYLAQQKATKGWVNPRMTGTAMAEMMAPAYARNLGLVEAGQRRAIQKKKLALSRDYLDLEREKLGWSTNLAQQRLGLAEKQMKQASRAATIGGIVDIGTTLGWMKYSGLLDNIWGALG